MSVIVSNVCLVICEADQEVTRWRYSDLFRGDAPEGVLRLASATAPDLARLDVADAKLAAEIVRRVGSLPDRTRAGGQATFSIVAWSLAAAASLVAVAVYLVPLLADRIAPLVPVSFERRLGEAVDSQVRALLGRTTCSNSEGNRALAALVERMLAKTSLPMPIEVTVIQSKVPNALALPGGRIYVLSALLERAESVDEVAGVLAHEMGHVAHRDGLRVLIQNSGTSFLFGLLFGDVIGGSAMIFVGRTLVDSAYSRAAETAADGFAADLMLGLGRSPKPLGVFLARLMKNFGGESRSIALLQSHPLSDERLAALSKAEPAETGAPLLSERDWQALRAICRP